MNKLFTVLVVLFALILPGCATYKAITTSPILQTSIKVGVGRVLANNPSWVLPTYKFSTRALMVIKTQEITNLGTIDDIFLQTIEKDLTPEEQDLAIDIFLTIKDAVLADLNGRGIKTPEAQKVYVLEALNWINQIAAIRL